MLSERTLDWKPNWDDKNMLFTVSAMDCFASGKCRPKIHRRKRVWLDQGIEGACTGFGTGHVLASTPLAHPGITNEIARAIYHEAQKQDEWDGEEYSGSSVNGAMKAARLQNYISEWRWCISMLEIKHAISYHGPLVIGVNWYSDMFSPDDKHVIHVTGTVQGGHALMLSGYDNEFFRLENSWGPGWGDNGGCWISSFDVIRLLTENGEFSCPKKIAF